MTSPWEKEQVNMRFNKEQKRMLENDSFKKHLEKEYDGFTDFVESKMHQELSEVPDLEEKIDNLESELQEKMKRLESLKQKKQRQDRQQNLRSKEKKLRRVQDKIRFLQDNEVKSEEEIRENKRLKMKNRAGMDVSDPETQKLIDRAVEKELEKQPDMDADLGTLVEEARRLQSEIAELNGGREDWFLEIEELEEVQPV